MPAGFQCSRVHHIVVLATKTKAPRRGNPLEGRPPCRPNPDATERVPPKCGRTKQERRAHLRR